MCETGNNLLEEIVANVFQDGVYVVRNGRHHQITPQQVGERWARLITNERERDGRLEHGHERRLFAWVRDHQVAFVHMDLGEPSAASHRGDWMPVHEITSWQPTEQERSRRGSTPA